MKITKTFQLVGLSAILLSIVFTASSCGDSQGAPTEQGSASSTLSIPDSIKKSDELYAQRADLIKLREGINILKEARGADSNNFELAWKLSQYNYFLGMHSEDDTEIKKAFELGIRCARSAIALKGDSPEGHGWLGANLGGRAQTNIRNAGSDRAEMRQSRQPVIKLHGKYHSGSAYMALGQLELATDGFMRGGDRKKALEYLERGSQISPENPMMRLRLAEAYIANKRNEDAKKQIDYILKIKPDPNYLPEYNDSVKGAKKLLEKLT